MPGMPCLPGISVTVEERKSKVSSRHRWSRPGAWQCVVLLLLLSLLLPLRAATGDTSATADHLKVLTVERKPFAMTIDGQLDGFSVDLLAALAEQLDWRYELSAADSFANMLDKVAAGDADLAIGNISITAEREQALDFSHPVFDAGLQILIPEAGGSSLGVLSAIFTWQMLGWVVLAVVVVFMIANLMWFFERREAPYFQREYRDGLWPSFWYAMHVMISGGFEEHVPRSLPARFLGVLLVICSLFLVSAFVAKIASTMTVSELRADIQSVADLYGKRVGTTRGSTAAAFLKSKSIDYRGFDGVDELFAALRAGKLDAVVHDAPVLRYHATTAGRGTTRVVGGIFKPEKYGIVFAQGSDRVEPLNRALLSLTESGVYAEIYRRWFGGGTVDN